MPPLIEKMSSCRQVMEALDISSFVNVNTTYEAR